MAGHHILQFQSPFRRGQLKVAEKEPTFFSLSVFDSFRFENKNKKSLKSRKSQCKKHLLAGILLVWHITYWVRTQGHLFGRSLLCSSAGSGQVLLVYKIGLWRGTWPGPKEHDPDHHCWRTPPDLLLGQHWRRLCLPEDLQRLTHIIQFTQEHFTRKYVCYCCSI